jgi:hypothetical protein
MAERDYQTQGYQAVVTHKGEVGYAADHKPGMRVPKGGSNCAKCEYLGKDRKTCSNKYFIRWNGSNVIPGKIDEYCSDWFEIR